MAVVTLVFLLSYSAWLVHAQDEPTQCPPVAGQPGCVCQHPDGIIDLTKIANCHGKPRFTGLTDPFKYTYDFNPCYKYSDGQCSDVYICQTRNCDHPRAEPGVIANTGEKIVIDPNDPRGNVYLHYVVDNGLPIYTKVYLHCDQSRTTPHVTTEGNPILSDFIFDVYSCAACPGGCCTGDGGGGGGGGGEGEREGGGGGGGGGLGGGGDGEDRGVSRGEGGGELLAAVFASTVPSVITIILLVVVIVLVCRLRKVSSSGQYIAFGKQEVKD